MLADYHTTHVLTVMILSAYGGNGQEGCGHSDLMRIAFTEQRGLRCEDGFEL